jgi:hypothetical protein
MPHTAQTLDKIRLEGFDGGQPPGFGFLFYPTILSNKGSTDLFNRE